MRSSNHGPWNFRNLSLLLNSYRRKSGKMQIRMRKELKFSSGSVVHTAPEPCPPSCHHDLLDCFSKVPSCQWHHLALGSLGHRKVQKSPRLWPLLKSFGPCFIDILYPDLICYFKRFLSSADIRARTVAHTFNSSTSEVTGGQLL